MAAVEDDLAPPWLLRRADQPDGAENGGAVGRFTDMMRTLRHPAAADAEPRGEGEREAAPDDGLLPEWLTRAARRVGLDRPRTEGAAQPDESPDPDDALAAPWVPRVPTRRPRQTPTDAGASPGSAAGTAATDPAGPAPTGEALTPPGAIGTPSGAPDDGYVNVPAPGAIPSGTALPTTTTGAAARTTEAGSPPDGSAPLHVVRGQGRPLGSSTPGAAGTTSGPAADGPVATPGSETPEVPGASAGGAEGAHLPGSAGATLREDADTPHPGTRGDGSATASSGPDGNARVRRADSSPAHRARAGTPAVPAASGTAARAAGEVVPGAAAGDGCARVRGVGAVETGEEARVVDSSEPPAAGGGPRPAEAQPQTQPQPQPQPRPAHADVPWEEAQRVAARAAEPAAAVTVPLDRAVRQVLAAPVEALADLPSFDTSAMDGWAVAGPGPWAVVGPPEGRGVLAGGGAPEPLADGDAVRIATGARIPAGATAVLRSERAELHGARLRLAADAPPGSTDPGTDIRPRGQECRTGARLLPSGTPVTPPVLGLAAAAGYDRLTVTPRPRAEVLVLGDELLHEGLPSEGRIRDALGPMVGPWLSALGAEVLVTRRLGDDADALYEAVTTTTADLVVTTGGTAHGPVDHVRPTLHRIGARLLVDGVEVRPGHPMLLAALAGAQRGRHLVGLPGNPLAAVSGLLTLAAPLLRARAGLPEPEPVRATLTTDVPGHPRDTRLVPVTRTADGSGATPLRWTGPAMLRGIAGASALAAVAPGGATAGMSVRLLELPW